MNAAPLLDEIVAGLHVVRLEAVLIGNAAAALRGAPVTTKDFDFLIRATSANSAKLKRLAARLGGLLGAPYEPVSEIRRIVRPPSLQIDFLTTMHGVRSFEGLKSRAARLPIGPGVLLLASLDDVIRSKRAAGRPKDRAVLRILEVTLEEEKKR